MQTNICQNIYLEAKDVLSGKKIKDLVIGISLIAVELSDSSIGVAYVLRNGLPPYCSSFGFAQNLIGKDAIDVAKLLIDGEDNLQKAVAEAVICAGAEKFKISNDDNSKLFGLDLNSNDIIGMIGYIGNIADMLIEKGYKLIIFDEGVSLYEDNVLISKMSEQKNLLPTCTKLIISGTSIINGTIDSLLEMSPNALQIALVGPSTAMYKNAFKGTKVVSLAGSYWDKSKKDEIFKRISLGGGISHITDFMIKANLKI